MCTMIVEKIQVEGSGKGKEGWFDLKQASVSYDHPFHAPFEHALNIDFLNELMGTSARVAVELSEQAARDLVQAILDVLGQAEASGNSEFAALNDRPTVNRIKSAASLPRFFLSLQHLVVSILFLFRSGKRGHFEDGVQAKML